MPALKFEIKRKCEVCGSIFVAKTLDSKSIPEAVAMYEVGKDTLYRLIRIGQIQSINLGARLTRINRKDIDKAFPKRFEKMQKRWQRTLLLMTVAISVGRMC